jgi:hypothetical protein
MTTPETNGPPTGAEVEKSLTTSGAVRETSCTPRKRAHKKRRAITGEIVPRGALKPNRNHPFAELPEGKSRRDAFIDALADALAELPRKGGEPLDS